VLFDGAFPDLRREAGDGTGDGDGDPEADFVRFLRKHGH
jgi:hypothetical protein